MYVIDKRMRDGVKRIDLLFIIVDEFLYNIPYLLNYLFFTKFVTNRISFVGYFQLEY